MCCKARERGVCCEAKIAWLRYAQERDKRYTTRSLKAVVLFPPCNLFHVRFIGDDRKNITPAIINDNDTTFVVYT